MSGELQTGDQVHVRTAKKAVIVCRVDKEGICKYCGAQIYWATTPNEKPMPIDPPDDDGQIVSHFATCPYADEAREEAKRRRDEGNLPGAGL